MLSISAIYQGMARLGARSSLKVTNPRDDTAGKGVCRLERGRATAPPLVVIVEAGMVGSCTLAILVWPNRPEPRSAPAGDHRQLAGIEAGGGFRLLAESPSTSDLNEQRRRVAA